MAVSRPGLQVRFLPPSITNIGTTVEVRLKDEPR